MLSFKWLVAFLLLVSFPSRGAAQSWKDKPIARWTEQDARDLLSSSPWAKTTAPEFEKVAPQPYNTPNGVSMKMPGLHGHRESGSSPDAPVALTRVLVRWESAMPVQSAEMKARNINAPDVDEGHYLVVVYRLPAQLADQLRRWKPTAELLREGKKPVKASDAAVLPLPDGTAVAFQFPRSAEISGKDSVVLFDAHMGQVHVKESFDLSEMVYAGKLEL